tara:strand:+ start:145 stop:357 length:213 start_codon:yes stop_codon:yes gene_type:complete
MTKIPLEGGNLDGLFIIIILIMIGPAVLFMIIGALLLAKKNKKAGKIFFILAGVYLLISFGVCGSMMFAP